MIYHFILNPKSGRSRRQKSLDKVIKEACKKRHLDYHIYYTTCRGDATEYVRSMVRISQERQRFICVGGDGSINEIVNSAPSNPNVEFGVIPKCSGNVFVRNFSNHKMFQNIDAQLDGDTISLALIKCNDYYCANMVNIGFDCAVVKEAYKIKKIKFISPGISYILGVVVVLFKKFGTKMKLIFDDGEVMEQEFTLTAIGNGKFCGGGFKSAPLADLSDGLADVCIIDKVSRLSFIQLVGSYKDGTFIDNKKARKIIKYKQTNHFRMEFEEPQPICIDGEISNAKSVDFTVIPGAFNFVIPKGSALRFPKK
jgi:YegS/Rv2252/BmrU family lipid kinase